MEHVPLDISRFDVLTHNGCFETGQFHMFFDEFNGSALIEMLPWPVTSF